MEGELLRIVFFRQKLSRSQQHRSIKHSQRKRFFEIADALGMDNSCCTGTTYELSNNRESYDEFFRNPIRSRLLRLNFRYVAYELKENFRCCVYEVDDGFDRSFAFTGNVMQTGGFEQAALNAPRSFPIGQSPDFFVDHFVDLPI